MGTKCRRIKKGSINRPDISRRKSLPDVSKLVQKVNKTVIGQEAVVKSVCTKIFEAMNFPQLKNNILIVGKSGTGKTEIIKNIAASLKIPCTIEDSTAYTEEGFVGASVRDMIYNLFIEAKGDINLASKGIIFIDEIDKKAQKEDNEASEVSKGGVLKSLLKLIEGTEIYLENPNINNMEMDDDIIKFDTSNIIFIFGGAFEGLDKIKKDRLKVHNKIGFHSDDVQDLSENDYMNTSFSKEDLINYGLPAEFVGRINNIYETRELQVSDFENILEHSKKSQFRKYEKALKKIGIELIYSKNIFKIIAQNTKRSATGARELNSYVSYIFEKIMYDVFSGKAHNKIILDDNIVFDNTKYRWE